MPAGEQADVVVLDARVGGEDEGVGHAVEVACQIVFSFAAFELEHVHDAFFEDAWADEPPPRGRVRLVLDLAAEQELVVNDVAVVRVPHLVFELVVCGAAQLRREPGQELVALGRLGLGLTAGGHLLEVHRLVGARQEVDALLWAERVELVEAHLALLLVRAVAGDAVGVQDVSAIERFVCLSGRGLGAVCRLCRWLVIEQQAADQQRGRQGGRDREASLGYLSIFHLDDLFNLINRSGRSLRSNRLRSILSLLFVDIAAP